MKNPLLLLLFFTLTSCQLIEKKALQSSKEGSRVIDSIVFDKKKDNPKFKLCNPYIFQYFNDSKGLIFKGGKPKIVEAFYNQYNSEIVPKETGLIRIRFVVNCKGKADRFRLLGMDNNYNEKIFDKTITKQLLKITKNLKGWGVKNLKGRPVDYYQHLIFSINNGIITKILP